MCIHIFSQRLSESSFHHRLFFVFFFFSWRYSQRKVSGVVHASPSRFSCLGQVEGVQSGSPGGVPGSSCTVGGHDSPHRICQPGRGTALLSRGDPGSAEQDAGWQPGHGVRGHRVPHLRPRLWTWGSAKEASPGPPPPVSVLAFIPWITVFNWTAVEGHRVKLNEGSVDALGVKAAMR